MDDYIHRDFIQAHLSGNGVGHWWQLFGVPLHSPWQVLGMMHVGLVPWWSSLNLSMALFRPLAATTHYFDYLLWPDQPAMMHLHNLLWYACLLVTLAAFFRGLWGRSTTALLALLLYAIDEAHIEGAAWIAGRNTVMTACFSMACLLCHHRATSEGKRWAAYLSPLVLALGFLSSEGAIAVWAYLLPYAVFLDERPLVIRLKSLIPAAAVTLTWIIFYDAWGYGMHGTGTYVNPTHPARFLAVLPERWLHLLRDQFVVPGIWAAKLAGESALQINRLSLVFGGVLLLASWSYLRRSRTLAFCLAGAVLSALPVCAASPTPPRLLFLTAVGAFGFVAEWLMRVAQDLRQSHPLRLHIVGLATTGLLMMLLHIPAALALSHRAALRPWSTQQLAQASAAGMPWGSALRDKQLVVLNTPNYFAATIARWLLHPPGPTAVLTLSASSDEVRVHRTKLDEFEIISDGGFLKEPWSTVVRSRDEPFQLGFRAPVGLFWVEVTELAKDGRPMRLRVVGNNLDDGSHVYCFWELTLGRCQITTLPKVGNTLIIPPFQMPAP